MTTEKTEIEFELNETVAYHRLDGRLDARAPAALEEQIGAQQKQIGEQNRIIARQQAELDALKELVRTHADSDKDRESS